jgi:hypothetical protein
VECAHDGVPQVAARVAAEDRKGIFFNDDAVFAVADFVDEFGRGAGEFVDLREVLGLVLYQQSQCCFAALQPGEGPGEQDDGLALLATFIYTRK